MIDEMFGAFVVAALLCWLSIPSIIRLAKQKRLFEPTDARKNHNMPTPTLGGIGIFIGFILSLSLFGKAYVASFDLLGIVAGSILLFFTGVKDDLFPLTPYKKLIAQLLAIAMVIFKGKVMLHGMYGFLGIDTLPTPLLYLLNFLVYVVIINAVNLVDGINGLAGSLALLVCMILGVWFAYYEASHLSIICFSLSGALLSFLYFNFRHNAMVFMGDTGSLIIGLIVSIAVISFIEQAHTQGTYIEGTAPVMGMALLVVPLTDTIRVFFIRLCQRRSPFSGDRNHLHHALLKANFTHIQSSLFLTIYQAIVIWSMLLMPSSYHYLSLYVLLSWAILLNLCVYWLEKKAGKLMNELPASSVKPSKAASE